MSVKGSSRSRSRSEPGGVRAQALVRPAILLLLREQESHGYELRSRLTELGVAVPLTSSGLYRTLQTMSEEKLLIAYWSTTERGPARRVYAITEEGRQYLDNLMPCLASLLQTVRGMLNRYRQLFDAPGAS